jgi:hypothetical protein
MHTFIANVPSCILDEAEVPNPFGIARNGLVKPKKAAEGARTLDLLHGKQTL